MNYIDTRIYSVSDYLNWVNKSNIVEVPCDIPNMTICFENETAYYRGQSRQCWKLMPGIFRNSFLDEHELLNVASIRLANEISSLRAYIDRLIFFQHYGLCTRLLDVTFNPLVALYMACCDESQYSCYGAVYCGHKSENRTSEIAEVTAKYIFEKHIQQIPNDLNNIIRKKKWMDNCFREPIFIRPAIINPRLEAQNGAFIMAPLINKNIIEPTINNESLDDSGFFDRNRAIISGPDKDKLLHELALLGINKGSIYKGVTAKIETIMIEAKWKSNLINNVVSE